MGELPTHGNPWHRARTLAERGLEAGPEFISQEERRRAERTLGRWRAQAPFDDSSWWRRRLALDGLGDLDESAVVDRIAGAGDPAVGPPPWAAGLEEIYRRGWEGPRPGGVFSVVEPLLGHGRTRLRERRPEIAGTDLEADLVRWLAEALHRRMARVLVLELHVAGLESTLPGDSPEARFRSFHGGLREPEQALDLLRRYPVLGKSLATAVEDWVEAAGDFVRHAEADRVTLGPLLGGADPGPPVAVRGSGGDPHRRGRSVLRVTFESGAVAAYKPRSLTPEMVFGRLLESLRGILGDDVPRWPGALDRGSRGWMPWVEVAPCDSAAAVERFYRRQGVLLALLHVLGTTDLHFENLIAVGEHPVPVDLETLTHPLLAQDGGIVDDGGLGDSVLRVGLLPHRLLVGGDAVDPSGLGAAGDQRVAEGGLRYEGAGTDRMRIAPAEGTLGETPGRPRFGGREADPADYGPQVRDGFRSGRRALVDLRDAWLAPGGGLEELWSAPVRVVLRPTRVYALLLTEGFHPQALVDAIERDQIFDRLWLGVRRQPFMESVVAAERRDLERGDVPVFTTRAGSRHLWDADGRDLGPLLPESAADGLRRRLGLVGTAEDDLQDGLIDAAFELRRAEQGRRARRGSGVDAAVVTGSKALAPSTIRGRWLALARRAGDELLASAFRGTLGATWCVPRRLAARRWTLIEAGPDLYYGLSGIALFLAALARETGEETYGDGADGAIETLRRQLLTEDPGLRGELGLASAGAYDGLGGVVYALVQLAHLRRDPALLDLAVEQLAPLASAVEADGYHDLVSGTAGALLAVRRLAAVRPESEAGELADRCGELLAARAEPQDVGVGWRPAAGGAPLAGLAHGVAGIAWALAEAGGHGASVGAALDYEESLRTGGNWRDVRPRPEGVEERSLVAWCHGAAGVGLGRLGMLEASSALDSSLVGRLEGDLHLAVDTLLERGFGLGHSLCHGDLGNLDALWQCLGRVGEDGGTRRRRASDLEVAVLESVETQGWRFGSPGGTRPPGLMVGLAGIGYGALRRAAPERVPSVLRLATAPGS
ncbi:MAG: type 2 lanthipeptide synthetase LanM family protein [Acidobacteriota bacterium]